MLSVQCRLHLGARASVPEGPDVGVAQLGPYPGVPGRGQEAVGRDEPVARPEDLVELDRELLVRLQPGPSGANEACVTAIDLAGVVRQDVVFEDDLGIE